MIDLSSGDHDEYCLQRPRGEERSDKSKGYRGPLSPFGSSLLLGEVFNSTHYESKRPDGEIQRACG